MVSAAGAAGSGRARPDARAMIRHGPSLTLAAISRCRPMARRAPCIGGSMVGPVRVQKSAGNDPPEGPKSLSLSQSSGTLALVYNVSHTIAQHQSP